MAWIEFRAFVNLDGEKMTSSFSLPSNYSLAFLSGTRHWHPQQRALPVTLFTEEITDLTGNVKVDIDSSTFPSF